MATIITSVNNNTDITSDILAWADAHKVYSREITLRLREELGEFSEVKFLRKHTRIPGTSHKNLVYVVDNKWQVTVYANCPAGGGMFCDEYSIEDYSKVVASQKAYGRRVGRLAKAADVPWNIAVFAGDIADDAEAVEVLKAVKAARGTADDQLQWELSCGIARRTAALEQMLGETWQKLSCRGQRQTEILAKYLGGEEEEE